MVEFRDDLILRRGYWVTPDGKSWHRIVYRKVYGRIPKGWEVHHIDGDSQNNDPANLIALPVGLHIRAHKGPLPSRKRLEDWLAGVEQPSQRAKKKKRREKKDSGWRKDPPLRPKNPKIQDVKPVVAARIADPGINRRIMKDLAKVRKYDERMIAEKRHAELRRYW